MKKNELQSTIDKHEKTIERMKGEILDLIDEKNDLHICLRDKEEDLVGHRAIVGYLDHKLHGCPEHDRD